MSSIVEELNTINLGDQRLNRRARRVLEKLTALGMPLSWERLLEITGGGLIGRPHIAEAMVERGYVS